MMGLEEVLAEEIKLLGGKNITIGKRSVHYTGDQMLLYKSNLYLRTALRVLKPISSFNVHNEDELYRNAKNIDWSFIEDNQTFAVESTVNSGHFRHSKYAALLIKDAIVDQKREKKGIRPNVDISSPDYRIHLHINQEEASISLDSSGDSLHRRERGRALRLPEAERPLGEHTDCRHGRSRRGISGKRRALDWAYEDALPGAAPRSPHHQIAGQQRRSRGR